MGAFILFRNALMSTMARFSHFCDVKLAYDAEGPLFMASFYAQLYRYRMEKFLSAAGNFFRNMASRNFFRIMGYTEGCRNYW